MRIRNVVVTLGIAAGAGALAVRGLMKNKELAQKAKEEGSKIINDTKNLGSVVKEAVNGTVNEIKDKVNEFVEANTEDSDDSDDSDFEDELKTADELEEDILTPEAKAEVEEELKETETKADKSTESDETKADETKADETKADETAEKAETTEIEADDSVEAVRVQF